MNEITLQLPDTSAIDAKVVGIVGIAKKFIIATDNDCRMCIDHERGLDALKREIEEHHNEGIELAHNLHKKLIRDRDTYLMPVIEAKKIYKNIRIIYTEKQEHLRKEEQARLEAEARRLEEERKLHEAEILEATGRNDEAIAVLEEEILTPVIPIMSAVPRAGVAGAIKTIYSAEVIDFPALVRAVAEGRANISYLQANMPILNAQARALKDNFKCDGVKIISRKV